MPVVVVLTVYNQGLEFVGGLQAGCKESKEGKDEKDEEGMSHLGRG